MPSPPLSPVPLLHEILSAIWAWVLTREAKFIGWGWVYVRVLAGVWVAYRGGFRAGNGVEMPCGKLMPLIRI